jgi:hypothetical protein
VLRHRSQRLDRLSRSKAWDACRDVENPMVARAVWKGREVGMPVDFAPVVAAHR